MKQTVSRTITLITVTLFLAQVLLSCSIGTVTPKAGPSEEEILSALSQASREAMKVFYEEYLQNMECGYFFNATCSMTILDGKITRDADGMSLYTATIESKNTWKYVDVVETERVNFTYNAESTKWELVDYVIESVTASWHVDGEYQGEEGLSFRLQTGDYVSGGSDLLYEEFDFMTSNYTKAIFTLRNEKGGVYTDEMVRLYAPCSKGIATGGGSFNPDEKDSRSPIYVIAHVYPEKIFYVDHMAPAYKKIALS